MFCQAISRFDKGLECFVEYRRLLYVIHIFHDKPFWSDIRYEIGKHTRKVCPFSFKITFSGNREILTWWTSYDYIRRKSFQFLGYVFRRKIPFVNRMLKIRFVYFNSSIPIVVSRQDFKTCVLKSKTHASASAKKINKSHR